MVDFTLRAVREADRGFLSALHATTRPDLLLLPEEIRDQVMDMQFMAKTGHYAKVYGTEGWRIVEAAGQAAGSIHTADVGSEDREILLVDIALLPQWRNQGVGSSLLRWLQEQAARDGKAIRLHVEAFSPARKLYERLGWVVKEKAPPNSVLMTWSPDGAMGGTRAD